MLLIGKHPNEIDFSDVFVLLLVRSEPRVRTIISSYIYDIALRMNLSSVLSI